MSLFGNIPPGETKTNQNQTQKKQRTSVFENKIIWTCCLSVYPGFAIHKRWLLRKRDCTQ